VYKNIKLKYLEFGGQETWNFAVGKQNCSNNPYREIKQYRQSSKEWMLYV